jgi:hypothetical protein
VPARLRYSFSLADRMIAVQGASVENVGITGEVTIY